MSDRLAYVNGQIAPESQSVVSIRDKGFVYGDAVFDTARTFGVVQNFFGVGSTPAQVAPGRRTAAVAMPTAAAPARSQSWHATIQASDGSASTVVRA